MIRILARCAGLAGALVLTLSTACAFDTTNGTDSSEPQSGEVRVQLQNLRFAPQQVTVRAGTRITFVNRDPMLHDVVQVRPDQAGKSSPGFASPALALGENWAISLDQPGTYSVICTQAAHYTAGMTGTITVVP